MMPKCPYFKEACLKKDCMAYHVTTTELYCHALNTDIAYKLVASEKPSEAKTHDCPLHHRELRDTHKYRYCPCCGGRLV